MTRRKHPGQHLTSHNPRGIRATWCPECHQPTLTGLNDNDAAWTIHVNYTPLTPLGEALAWINNQPTAELRKINNTPQLQRRNKWTIPNRPPGSHQWCGPIDVLPQHQCNAPPLPTQNTTHPPTTTPRETNDDQPPY